MKLKLIHFSLCSVFFTGACIPVPVEVVKEIVVDDANASKTTQLSQTHIDAGSTDTTNITNQTNISQATSVSARDLEGGHSDLNSPTVDNHASSSQRIPADAVIKSIVIPLVQDGRITIDGKSDDWGDLQPVHQDPEGDHLHDIGDMTQIYFAADSKYLYYRLELKGAFLKHHPEVEEGQPDPYDNIRYEVNIFQAVDSPEFKLFGVWPQTHIFDKGSFRMINQYEHHENDLFAPDESAGIIEDIIEARVSLDWLEGLNGYILRPRYRSYNDSQQALIVYDQTDYLRVTQFSRPSPSGHPFPAPPQEEEGPPLD